MLNLLRGAGISGRAIDIIVIIMAVFFAIVGLALVTLGFYDNVTGTATPTWVGVGIGSIISFMGWIVASHQTSTQINGTAAKAAAGAVTGMQPTISQMANLIAQAPSMAPIQPTMQGEVQENTKAIQENTEATSAETAVEKHIHEEHEQ